MTQVKKVADGIGSSIVDELSEGKDGSFVYPIGARPRKIETLSFIEKVAKTTKLALGRTAIAKDMRYDELHTLLYSLYGYPREPFPTDERIKGKDLHVVFRQPSADEVEQNRLREQHGDVAFYPLSPGETRPSAKEWLENARPRFDTLATISELKQAFIQGRLVPPTGNGLVFLEPEGEHPREIGYRTL